MKYLYTFTAIDKEGKSCEGELIAEDAVTVLAIIKPEFQFASCIRQHEVSDDRQAGISRLEVLKNEGV